MGGVGNRAHGTGFAGGRLASAGGAFAALGAVAALLPRTGWVGLDIGMALVLAAWGTVGLGFACMVHPVPDWRPFAGFFTGLGAAGLVSLTLSPVDPNGLTILIVLGLLAQGVLSVMFGLQVSPRLPGWRGAVASGRGALGAGLYMVAGWPDRSARLVGLFLGATFLATALALLRLAMGGPSTTR